MTDQDGDVFWNVMLTSDYAGQSGDSDPGWGSKGHDLSGLGTNARGSPRHGQPWSRQNQEVIILK